MINRDRIVPVMRSDLLTLLGTMMKLAGTTVTAVEAADVATFNMASGSGNVIANEPVKTFNFASAVTAAVVYFIPDYDYQGFSVNGTAVTAAGVEVVPDGCTLYKATLASGAVTISDLWNYGGGDGVLSPYFYQRAAQLAYK